MLGAHHSVVSMEKRLLVRDGELQAVSETMH